MVRVWDLTSLVLQENNRSFWVKTTTLKLQDLGFSPGYDRVKTMIKQRVFNIEQQRHNNIPNFMTSKKVKYAVTPTPYLS